MNATGLTDLSRTPGRWGNEIKVDPTQHNTNPNPLVEGPTIRLPGVHAKVRRGGYRRRQLRPATPKGVRRTHPASEQSSAGVTPRDLLMGWR
jgi:hypothetical protein